MRSREPSRSSETRRKLQSRVAAWVCLLAMALQMALPFVHEIGHHGEAHACGGAATKTQTATAEVDSSGCVDGHGHDEATCAVCRVIAIVRNVALPKPQPTIAAPTFVGVVARATPHAEFAIESIAPWFARPPPAAA